MKYFSYLLILLVTIPLAQAAKLTDVSEKNLGSGLRELSGKENGNTVRVLYYQQTRLGQLGNYSISPSGSYVVFQDSPAGNLYLFRIDDEDLEQLTTDFIAPARKYNWNEKLEFVEVTFTGRSQPQFFALE